MIGFTCRWFAFDIGYNEQYDETGIFLYGPVRVSRSTSGRLRWQCNVGLCWYGIDGQRIWHRYRQLSDGTLMPLSRIWVLH